VSIFQEVPIFSELPQEALDWLSEKAQRRQHPRGTIVLAEGQPGAELFVIESGRAKVFVSNADGKELVLYHAGPGDYIGELSILDSQPRSASVQTLEKTSLLVLNQSDFKELLSSDPEFSLSIIQTLTSKLRIATNQVRSLGLDPVYRRLTSLLDNRAEPEGDERVIAKMSHRQIADQIGSSREMVSKLMRDLEQGGYVATEGSRIVIRKTLPSQW